LNNDDYAKPQRILNAIVHVKEIFEKVRLAEPPLKDWQKQTLNKLIKQIADSFEANLNDNQFLAQVYGTESYKEMEKALKSLPQALEEVVRLEILHKANNHYLKMSKKLLKANQVIFSSSKLTGHVKPLAQLSSSELVSRISSNEGQTKRVASFSL
jgi:hypothetical protein